MHINNGWLTLAERILSPNIDDRPEGTAIDLLVIHNISLPPNQFGGGHIAELFTNCLNPAADDYFAEICGLKVSAHLLIDRLGCHYTICTVYSARVACGSVAVFWPRALQRFFHWH